MSEPGTDRALAVRRMGRVGIWATAGMVVGSVARVATGDPVWVAVGAALANSATGLINPVAGLVTYLAQKIMQDPIEKLFSYEYAVTGAWKDPQVDKLASREPERDSAQPLSR